MGRRSSTVEASLSRSEADDVLRYWLAALRLEEALETRPQARRTTHSSEPPRLDMPTPGQDYFKLPLGAELGALLVEQRSFGRPMDGELSRFFETWLHGQYRRNEDERELSHLLSFPVVHLPRGELAGLLRCGVSLRFGKGPGELFRVPSFAERQRGSYPAVPDHAFVARAPRAEGAWPFFVDTRLLRHPLGVSPEDIDGLFEALRGRDDVSELEMLRLMAELLESTAGVTPAPPGCDVESLLHRLTLAMRRLLEQAHSRAQVYPVGIVIDGSQARTTWHLQREIVALAEARGDLTWSMSSALGAYLTGRSQPSDSEPQRALFPGPTLTASQRVAAEQFWGSKLSAVQGPPGTGKTTLILHLCAEALLCQVEGVVDGEHMGERLLVVASSNNRAVDNVLEPLAGEGGLPLALRAGSRQVCEQVLAVQLRQTLRWLKDARENSTGDAIAEELLSAVADFRALRAELDAVLMPRREAVRHSRERARLSEALARLSDAPGPSAGDDADLARIPEPDASRLLGTLGDLEKRFVALSKLCEAKPGLAQVNAVARHYGHTASRDLTVFENALASTKLTLDLPLPPLTMPSDLPSLMEAWEEGTEQCLSRLADLRERLERVRGARKHASELAQISAELAALGSPPEGAWPVTPNHDLYSQGLFGAALRVREAWARAHAHELIPALEVALGIVERERSLRPLFRNDPHSARLLTRLFAVWGSTLLSLGNVFPPEAGNIARVVIDEAGQCHPAHAVSALMRAEAALIIGDVHQLAPVVELTVDDEARLFQSCRLKSLPARLLPYRIHGEAQISAQTLASRAVATPLSLTDHFRCQPEIIAISDALCDYGLTVHTPRATRLSEASFLAHPVAMVDLAGEQERLFGSLCNELELSHTLALLQRILGAGVAATDLAVITPYRGQLERLRRRFAELRIPLEYSIELQEGEQTSRASQGVALGTVHRFQGGERSIVLFSSVVSRPSSLPFLNARPNLLNVAISRARHHFVCLGHRAVLEQGTKTRLLTRAARPLVALPLESAATGA